MKVLITGVAGHVGCCFARWLQTNTEATVVGLDDYSCGYVENVPTGIEMHEMSLGADKCTQEGLPLVELLDGVDYVFHFAAYAAEGLSPFIRHYDTTNNLLSTVDVLNACLNIGSVKRVVFTSSMSIYGSGVAPFAESLPRRPIDPYGISKAACEQHLEIAYVQHSQDYCIIRPHNIYGPYQSCWQVFRNVLGNWMARAKQGQPLLVYGDGRQTRAFSYVDDIMPCLWQAAINPEASTKIVNLGGGTAVSIGEAAKVVAALTDGEVKHVEQRYEVKHAFCTTARSETLLGYKDTTPFEEGVAKMWAWFCEAWEQYPYRRGSHKVTDVEVKRGLYPFWRPYV